MRRILLTGAGLTRNWGGYLAREVWERLLGHPTVRADEAMRSVFLGHCPNFESAVTEIRALGGDHRARIDDALVDVFTEQDELHKGGNDERHTRFRRDTFSDFIRRFGDDKGTGRIFTLNQDVFLERKYTGGELYAPGVGSIGLRSDGDPWEERKVDLDASTEVKDGVVNYFKVHGSFNWRSSKARHVVVAGTDKVDQLRDDFALLAKYFAAFSQACCEPDTWLVTAGYSFCDDHINDEIAKGVGGGLKVVIVNTADPISLFGKREGSLGEIWNAIVGYCSLPFSRVFDGNQAATKTIDYCLGAPAG